MTDLPPLTWRKSSRSGENGNSCVELACGQAERYVRDSKNPDGPVLGWSPKALGAFLAGIKDGQLG